MRVMMRTTYAGPRGTCSAGGFIDLPDAEAKSIIDGNYGVEVKSEKSVQPTKPAEPESTATEPSENTSLKPTRSRKIGHGTGRGHTPSR